MTLIELRLVGGTGLVEELLAAVRPGRLVGSAMQDQHRQGDPAEFALEPLAGVEQVVSLL